MNKGRKPSLGKKTRTNRDKKACVVKVTRLKGEKKPSWSKLIRANRSQKTVLIKDMNKKASLGRATGFSRDSKMALAGFSRATSLVKVAGLSKSKEASVAKEA